MTLLYKAKRTITGVLLAVLVMLAVAGVLTPVFAEPERPLDVRVERLERLMSSQKQLELLYRMQQLQEENQQLRALLEEQANEIHLLKRQQKERYTDLERRLSRMEGGASTKIMTTVKSEPVTVPAVRVLTPKREYQPVVVDKSSVEQTNAEQAKVEPKPAVYKKQALSKKERLDEKNMYQKAYDELSARQYSKARESFNGVIKKYPGGRYAHIAQYWVAESSYAQRHYQQAIIDYQLLLDVYPLSPKKAEAELKKAYSYYELGNNKTARQTLNQLLINYPDTTEAGQAKRLLKQL